MSDNLDNLLGEIYSSSSQSQGVKELANLINNLSQLLLRGISQLEARVLKIEQQMGMSKAATPARPLPPPPPPTTQSPVARSTPAPMPKVASPFSTPTPPATTPKPPPPVTAAPVTAAPVQSSASAPSVSEAASMLGVTLKKAPTTTTPSSSSGPSFLTSTVSQNATPTVSSTTSEGSLPSAVEPDASAPANLGEGGGGIAGPTGGFRGELAEKLARRRQKVQEQLDDDFTGLKAEDSEEEEESTSSELKLDLEDELRNAFSKLKG